jgi:replicative DNA helicase
MNKGLALRAIALVKTGLSEFDIRSMLAGWLTRQPEFSLGTGLSEMKDEFEACLSYAYGLQKSVLEIDYNHAESISDTISEIGKAKDRQGALKGITSGLPDIDRKINGWQHGLFYVFGGLKKTGKSRFVLSLASHWLKRGCGGIMFSLEMGPQKIHQCIFANREKVNTAVMGTASISQDEFMRISQEANSYQKEHFFISKKSGISPEEIREVIKIVKARWPVDFIIVDYIQRMKAKAESRTKEVERCALELADIARDENVIMIALSQLSGEAEKHQGEKAIYSYLKESQAILESADCGIMLFDKNRGVMNDGFELTKDSKEIVAQIIQRDGESDISFVLNAQLQYAFFGCSDRKHEGGNHG